MLLVLVIGLGLSALSQPVNTAKSFVIRDLKITGNERTQPYVFDRFLDIEEGAVLELSELLPTLDRNRKHLLRTALFTEVELVVTRMVADSIDIEVKVAERWYYFIYPYFELSDRNFNEWWTTFDRDINRTIFGATFYINNIRGRDERLKLMALFGFNQEFTVRYTQPFLKPGSSFGWEAEGYLWRTRNLAYTTRENILQYQRTGAFAQSLGFGAARLLYQPNAHWKVSFGSRYGAREILDTIRSLNPNYLTNGNTQIQHIDLTLDARWDNTDHIAYPLRGNRVRLQAEKLGLGVWQDINALRVDLMAGWYRPISRKLFAEARAFAGITIGQNRPYFLQKAIGYQPRMVRGYELSVVDGQRYAVLQSSIKWQLLDWQLHNRWMPIEQFATIPIGLYLRPHLDIGYAADRWNTEENPLHNTPLLGFGIGLDLVTYYDYALSVNFSANRQGEKGLYLHVNF